MSLRHIEKYKATKTVAKTNALILCGIRVHILEVNMCITHILSLKYKWHWL